MKTLALSLLIVVVGLALALHGWRRLDHRADRAQMDRLLALQPQETARFSHEMVAGLPEPAQRYFRFAIAEGTPLHTVAQIEMVGRFSLGTKADPAYLDMRATQVLAAPVGFMWKMSAGSGLERVSGSDSASWTRFWLAEFVPVARLGGDRDHERSAFGRYVSEAVFWTPAALLPGPGIEWTPVDDHVARVTVRHGDLEQSVDLTVAPDGRPIRVSFLRWSDANPEKIHRLQPFGGELTEFREFQGFRVPTRVEAGNHFGTDAYFPFFVADVVDLRFPVPPARR